MNRTIITLFMSLMIFATLISAASANLNTSLIAYYPLDSDFTDAHNSFNLAGINTPTNNATAVLGNAYWFAEGSNEYAYGNGTHNISDYPWSVNAWVYMIAGETDGVIFGITDFDASTTYYDIRANSIANTSWQSGNLVRRNTATKVTYSLLPISDGWHMVTGVFTSATNASTWIDGAYENTNTESVTFSAGATSTTIGRNSRSSPASYLNGGVDEVGLWGRALNETEIGWLFNSGSGLAYPFNIGAPPPPTDASLVINSPANFTHNNSGVTFNVTPTSYTDATVNITFLLDGEPVYTNGSVISNQSYAYDYTTVGAHALSVWLNATTNNVEAGNRLFSVSETIYNLSLTLSQNLTDGLTNGAREAYFTLDDSQLWIGSKNGAAPADELVVYNTSVWSLGLWYDMTTTVNPQHMKYYPLDDEIVVIGVSRDDNGKSLHVYNTTTWTEITRVGGGTVLHDLEFNANGTLLFYEDSNDINARVFVIDTSDTNPLNWVHIANFSYDYGGDVFEMVSCGDYFAFSNTADSMWIWNISTNDPTQFVNISGGAAVANRVPIDFTNDCNFLLTSDDGGNLIVYRVPSMDVYKTLALPNATVSAFRGGFNKNLTVSNENGIISGWAAFASHNGSHLLNLADWSWNTYYQAFNPATTAIFSTRFSYNNRYMVYSVTDAGAGEEYTLVYNVNGLNPTLNIQAKDALDNTSISNFTVTLENGSSYSTTNGVLSIIVNNITDYDYNLTFVYGAYGAYFNVSGLNINVTDLSTHYSYPTASQSVISFAAYEIATNNSLGGSTFSVNGTTNTSFILKEGSNYIVTAVNAGYFDKNLSFSVAAFDNKTLNIEAIGNGFINVTANDNFSGGKVNIFSATINFNNTYNYTNSTTNGEILFPILRNINYTISLTAGSYISPADQEINASSAVNNVTFSVAPSNSINISFYFINNTLIIGEQINATIINTNASQTSTTTSGVMAFSLLIPDDYELRATAADFLDRKYFFTIANFSTQSVHVYLFQNITNITTELQVFRILDTSNTEVTGAILKIEKETIAGSNLYSNYGEEITNAEGETNVYLEKGISHNYRFAVVVDGALTTIYPTGNTYTSTTNFISGVSETVEIVVNRAETAPVDYITPLYAVSTSSGRSNDTVWCSWIDGQNGISGATMEITARYLDNSTGQELINTQTSIATSGNLTYTFTPINDTIYTMSCYINYPSYDSLEETLIHAYTLTKTVDKNTGLLYAVGILAVAATLTVVFGVLVSSILTFAMLAFTGLVGFTSFPLTVITSLIALAIILFVRGRKNDE